MLFGTTDEFLKRFELESLEQLPKYEELLAQIKVLYAGTENDSIYNEFEVVPLEEGEESTTISNKA